MCSSIRPRRHVCSYFCWEVGLHALDSVASCHAIKGRPDWLGYQYMYRPYVRWIPRAYVGNGEDRISPGTRGNQHNDQPSRGRLQDGVRTRRNQTKCHHNQLTCLCVGFFSVYTCTLCESVAMIGSYLFCVSVAHPDTLRDTLSLGVWVCHTHTETERESQCTERATPRVPGATEAWHRQAWQSPTKPRVSACPLWGWCNIASPQLHWCMLARTVLTECVDTWVVPEGCLVSAVRELVCESADGFMPPVFCVFPRTCALQRRIAVTGSTASELKWYGLHIVLSPPCLHFCSWILHRRGSKDP